MNQPYLPPQHKRYAVVVLHGGEKLDVQHQGHDLMGVQHRGWLAWGEGLHKSGASKVTSGPVS